MCHSLSVCLYAVGMSVCLVCVCRCVCVSPYSATMGACIPNTCPSLCVQVRSRRPLGLAQSAGRGCDQRLHRPASCRCTRYGANWVLGGAALQSFPPPPTPFPLRFRMSSPSSFIGLVGVAHAPAMLALHFPFPSCCHSPVTPPVTPPVTLPDTPPGTCAAASSPGGINTAAERAALDPTLSTPLLHFVAGMKTPMPQPSVPAGARPAGGISGVCVGPQQTGHTF
jgi:hypothetical protein